MAAEYFKLFGNCEFLPDFGLQIPLLNGIPIFLPGCWYVLNYTGLIIGNFIEYGQIQAKYHVYKDVLWLSVLFAFVVTAFDFVLEPIYSTFGGTHATMPQYWKWITTKSILIYGCSHTEFCDVVLLHISCSITFSFLYLSQSYSK